MTWTPNPLVGAAPARVPLPQAPLVRVIVQLRFPEILGLDERAGVASFQERIRSEYPFLEQERSQQAAIGPAGLSAMAPPAVIWRFQDLSRQWRVSLGTHFLTLETVRYSMREDLLSRFRRLLDALEMTVKPTVRTGLGVRYVNRLTDWSIDELRTFVRPELLGLDATNAAEHSTHLFTETAFPLDNGRLTCRYGRVPPGVAFDESVLDALPIKSWVLDVDRTIEGEHPLAIDDVRSLVEQGCERCNAFFRWAVTDDLLVRYGGKP